ncbi:MAG: phospholipid-binding protein MlaC [Candidatus Methylomirabilales bacterium]
MLSGIKRRKGSLWMVLVLALFLGDAHGAAAGGPLDRVRETLDGARRLLQDPALAGPERTEARREKIGTLIRDGFDYRAMARQALGEHWKRLSTAQRRHFVALFGELFERSYTRLVVSSLEGQTITYEGEQIAPGGRAATVPTVLITKGGERLPVEYQLRHHAGRWVFVDVTIDGVSIVKNYQIEFNRIIGTRSYDELVRKMEIKRREAP